MLVTHMVWLQDANRHWWPPEYQSHKINLKERLMFTISVSFWSLNLNQKLLWLLPPFLLFNVCKHQYIKKTPERTRFGEKIKWPRIYICSLNTNTCHHQIQNSEHPCPMGILFEESIDFLRMHFMNWSPTTVKVPKKIFTFFLCFHYVVIL